MALQNRLKFSSVVSPHSKHQNQFALHRACTLIFVCGLSILLLAACSKSEPIAPASTSSTTSSTVETAPAGPETTLPYLQPEYHVEIPEGYEALLPDKTKAPRPAKPATSPAAKPVIPPKAGNRYLIIIIDDAGYSLSQLKPFLNLPFPLTIAVLPQLEYSRKAAEAAHSAAKEVILHQPMEALGGNNPGPSAVMLAMSDDEIRATITKNLDSLPEAAGMNNHMGSAVTRDERIMRIVLDLAKKRGIYYLDSLTAPGTVTAAISRELSLHSWERDVFLDNTGDRLSILRALDDGKKTATSKGVSIMIGHVWSAELAQTLMDIYPQLVEQGYSLTTISKYMMLQTGQGEDDVRSWD